MFQLVNNGIIMGEQGLDQIAFGTMTPKSVFQKSFQTIHYCIWKQLMLSAFIDFFQDKLLNQKQLVFIYIQLWIQLIEINPNTDMIEYFEIEEQKSYQKLKRKFVKLNLVSYFIQNNNQTYKIHPFVDVNLNNYF
ncbi:unnamed protein product (macronuclear) [Paramecium tetraurelia]|uniref:Uncharacterized protein n=1 Tax=Paramecium tetraurelia TaxID=5888 RepID=A0CGH7_PARTE|nr:uncharacterized protein GSPATT00007334001 [Paramecium tetraurelia]CAK69894.1 unnamed protein product [Paramecium tetraurelia]|eukprot:XP_001437291.1 hypothetical protein (macronuclear) [Paramecium tetraurelia strain d4-2]